MPPSPRGGARGPPEGTAPPLHVGYVPPLKRPEAADVPWRGTRPVRAYPVVERCAAGSRGHEGGTGRMTMALVVTDIFVLERPMLGHGMAGKR